MQAANQYTRDNYQKVYADKKLFQRTMNAHYHLAITENKDIREVIATSPEEFLCSNIVLFECAESIEDWYIIFDAMILNPNTKLFALIVRMIYILAKEEAASRNDQVIQEIHAFWRHVCSKEILRPLLETYFKILLEYEPKEFIQVRNKARRGIKIYNSQIKEKIEAYTSWDYVTKYKFFKLLDGEYKPDTTKYAICIEFFNNPDQLQRFYSVFCYRFKNTKACVSKVDANN